MSMSIRQFARHLGVAEGTIRKAIKSGRIPAGDVGRVTTDTLKTRPVIDDPVSAAYNFRRNTNHALASNEKDLESDVDLTLKELRLAREKIKTRVDISKHDKHFGKIIDRNIARQTAISVAHTALNDLRTAVRSKRLTKKEQLAAIDACELEIMDTMEKRFASDAD